MNVSVLLSTQGPTVKVSNCESEFFMIKFYSLVSCMAFLKQCLVKVVHTKCNSVTRDGHVTPNNLSIMIRSRTCAAGKIPEMLPNKPSPLIFCL